MSESNYAIKGEKCAGHATSGGAGTICEVLWERLRDVREARGHGLYEAPLVNMEDGRPSRSVIVYKMGAKDRGVTLNFCPWCGGTLHSFTKAVRG